MSEDRFIVGIGEGKFDVIAGHKLNDEPLSRAEADRLASEARSVVHLLGPPARGANETFLALRVKQAKVDDL
jgi:hypothetical protein